MEASEKLFPWKVFLRTTAAQVLVVLAAVAAGFASQHSLWALAFFALCLVGLTIWNIRKLVFPIGRLLFKTQNLVSQSAQTLQAEEFKREPFGEWSDLESNIDTLRQNLERTTQNLALEQTELDTVMGAISDAILAVDLEGVPLFYNSRFELVFGGGSIRRNTRLFEIFREPEILSAFRKALKDGRGSDTKAFAIEFKGEKRFFSLGASPLRKQGGTIYGAIGIFHDITELKAAEQMRIDFVANVSHELRTPLTSIKGYAETMADDLKKSPTKLDAKSASEYLTVITRNTSRLMNLMEDLLDLSSLEGTTMLQKEPLSTEELSNRFKKNFEEKCAAKKQEFSVVVEAKSVQADPNRIEQVLINLLDNAHKYTPEWGKITLSWENDKSGGKEVYLKVKDSGPGIAPEHQSRLFERFYRIDKARSREQGGTGLGLAIVKHIMQRHEGSVWLESEIGWGSTFICRFPG